MGISKVLYNSNTLIDLTADTVTPIVLRSGYKAHDKSGNIITGTYTGTDVSSDTVTPTTLLKGYTAHAKNGVKITGTYVENANSFKVFREGVYIEPSATRLFYNNQTINSPIIVGDMIKVAEYMLFNCSRFNSPVTLGTNVYLFRNMLRNCTSFGSNVYVKIKSSSYALMANGIFNSCNNSKRKNIFFNSVFNDRFNITSSYSLVGAAITWTAMTNGFYNAAYNIYCYNNYAG